MTTKETDAQALIRQLGQVFCDREAALGLLESIEFPIDRRPEFKNFDNSRDYWRHVCAELEKGVVVDGLPRLLSAAKRMYPGNEFFASYGRSPPHTSAPPAATVAVEPSPDRRQPDSQATIRPIRLVLPDDISDEEVASIIRSIREFGRLSGRPVQIDLMAPGSIIVSLSTEATADEQEALREAIAQQIAARGIQATVTAPAYQHRDYFLDPLHVEGPDGVRYEIDQVRASTRVSELARAVVDNYDRDFWPADKAGQRSTVVDHIDPATGGRRRLRGDQTLHESGVRPRDTLAVLPEAVAGIVNPFLNAEALVQVRNQIQEFAAANPTFQVEVNSAEIPTEYVFSFPARSFADAGVPIDHHRVFVQFPREFPLEAPVVFWQTDIFHPNIDPKYGIVCLGALADSYRSGLHFGMICQMLVDMAGYRNYVVDEGYNVAAAQWAASPAGQDAIRNIGGAPLPDKNTPTATPRLRLRRVDGAT